MLSRLSLVGLGLVSIALVAVFGNSNDAAHADDDAELRKAVRHIVGQIAKNDKGPRTGLKGTDALALADGSAHMVGAHILPISATPYGPKGDWHGTLMFMLDDDEEQPLDGVEIVLLCDKYDKRTMGHYLVAMGAEHGMTLEPDAEEDDLFWDAQTGDLQVWIALGGEALWFSVSPTDEE